MVYIFHISQSCGTQELRGEAVYIAMYHVYTIILMVIFMLLYKVCLIQAHCVLCSCIVFKLIVYGRVHVLYSSSLCMVVFMYCI